MLAGYDPYTFVWEPGMPEDRHGDPAPAENSVRPGEGWCGGAGDVDPTAGRCSCAEPPIDWGSKVSTVRAPPSS